MESRNSFVGATQNATLRLLVAVMSCYFCSQIALAVNRTSKPIVPAVILFGDSIVDPGNNNAIKTIAKCNFPPYGKDFIGHVATGRFCNGRIPGDLIASTLGVKEIVPAYVGQNLGAEDLLTGVSFASGATGYDPLTPIYSSAISMPDQLKLFAEYKGKLKNIAGEERADDIIKESLYVVCSGSNDLANTYFITPFRQPHYDIPSYVNLLVSYSSQFIQNLYQMGARKIGFVGLPPVGCLPSQRTLAGGLLRGCVPVRNEAAELYNSKINAELERLSTTFEGTKLVYLDIYTIILDFVQRPSVYGFEVSNKGCCGTGEIEASILCNPKSPTCLDDTKYVFWDSYHPTERAYKIIVDYLFQRYLKYLL
ncbi:GDSL esterase/lipase EXL3-like [Phalaenopsis equestris]|uniref:GDSL esterase/lipase EXL3-like n=1 Tax=Phalaenopsis equestris TaxID=78828 RepID=UPI0009E503EA|nr:GDSL esterase/lipase EXL3-like [Phalaenopsis equestris]